MDIVITSHPAASTAYQVLKDFQTFAAALVALIAAVVTFYSAQRVVKVQSTTSRELADRQAAEERIKEEETIARKRVAFLIRAVHLITTLIRNMEGVLSFFEIFSQNPKSLSEHEINLVWEVFIMGKNLSEEYLILRDDLDDVSILSSDDQYHILDLVREIFDTGDAFDLLKKQGRTSKYALAFAKNSAETLKKKSKELKEKFNNSIADEIKRELLVVNRSTIPLNERSERTP